MNKIAILSALLAVASAKGDAFASLEYPCAKYSSSTKAWAASSYAAGFSSAKSSAKTYTDTITLTLDAASVLADGCAFISAGAWMVTWTPVTGTAANDTLFATSAWTLKSKVCTGTDPYKVNGTSTVTTATSVALPSSDCATAVMLDYGMGTGNQTYTIDLNQNAVVTAASAFALAGLSAMLL